MNTLLALVIVAATICMAVMAYLVHVNKRMSKEEKKTMYLAFAISTAAAWANVATTTLNGAESVSPLFLGLCKAVEHSLGPSLLLITARIVRRDKAGTVLGWLFMLNAVIQFASIRTGWAFTYDAEHVYHPGTMNAFTSFCSVLGSIYLPYVFYSFSRAYPNRNTVVLLLIMAVTWFGAITHIMHAEIQLMFFCSMLSVILIYIYMDDFRKQVQNEKFTAQMSIMDTLTLNFECVYKVDIATHCFEALRVSELIGRQLGGKFTPETKYETGMEAYCGLNVYEKDREMFRANTGLDYILANLKDQKCYTLGYRVLRDGQTKFFNMSAYKIMEGDRVTHLLIGFADVDEQRRRWENLMKISTTDQMTGLYNRRAYNEELDRIAGLSAQERSLIEAVMIDLNGLKQTNDSYGHEAGDELIISSARIMEKVYGKVGKVFRMGGDEFVVIASLPKQDSAAYVKELKDTMAGWKGIYIDRLSASVGVARIDETEKVTPMEEVIKAADARMYADKAEYYKLHDRRKQSLV